MTTTCGSPRLVIAACAGLLALTLIGSASAQSLGALARDEAARRKATPAGKTYTNADLPAAEPSPAAAAAGAPAQTPSTSASSDSADAKGASGDAKAGSKEPSKKDEAYWREKMKAAREGKARAESFAEALQSRINALSTDFANRDDPAQRNTIATDRQKALDELTRVKKEIADYTKAIADLQADARKEGVPAGWVR